MSAEEPRLFIAVYTDEDVTDLLAVLLRQRGHDAISTYEAEMAHASDDEQLAFATAQGRAILTFNRNDFLALHREWFAQGQEYAGIIISPQFYRSAVGELLRQMLNLLNEVTADDMWNTVRYLHNYR